MFKRLIAIVTFIVIPALGACENPLGLDDDSDREPVGEVIADFLGLR